MSEPIFTAHENCIYAGDPPLLTGNQSRLVAECSSPQRAAFIVRAVNSHEALVAAAQTLRCLETSPRFQGMTVAEAIAELKNNGACGDAESALKLAGAA